MKKWKKFAALGLTAAMVLGMTACGNSSGSSGQSSEPAEESAPKTEESTPAENTAGGGETQEETTGDEQSGGIVYEGPDSPVTLTFWNGFTGTDGEVLVDIFRWILCPGILFMRSFHLQLRPRRLPTLC